MKYLIAIIIYTTIITTHVNAQKVYTHAQLKEDLNTLKNIIVGTNPILKNNERDSLNAALNQSIKTFNLNNATGIDFLRYFKTLNFSSKLDEHAGLNFGPEFFPDTALVYFPLPIYIVDKKILVNIENSSIPFGSIIHSINGIEAAQIIDDLLGNKDNITPFKTHILNDNFSIAYYIMNGPQKQFSIMYTAPGNNDRHQQKIVSPVNAPTYFKNMSARVFPLYKNNPNEIIQTGYNEQAKTYYIKVGGFKWFGELDTLNTPAYFMNRFSYIFDDVQAKKPGQLIIDIRDNNGGIMQVPGILFSFLYEKPFTETFQINMPPQKNIPLAHLKMIDAVPITSQNQAKQEINSLYASAQKNKTNVYETIVTRRQPNHNGFTGKVYLLTNGGTFSAAAYFAALFKGYSRGEIIGQTTGGSARNITAGNMLYYELPHTKIGVSVPVKNLSFGKELYSRIKETYIEPDVKNSFKTIYPFFIKKQDWELEYVMKKAEPVK